MAQFWWVIHNQTALQEIDGQHLWSPKTESNGARSEFYNNMRRATPGDLVVSYADQAIRYIGRIAEFVFTAPKPMEFGETGAYWNQEGWLLPNFGTPGFPSIHPQDNNTESRPAPAEAIFAIPSSFGLRQSESLSNRHSTEYLRVGDSLRHFRPRGAVTRRLE
ncbi:hypothetical protein CIT25_05925 [Mesorhizobium mediterraneum]|uniref:EVE domain-containing protein n=1 Tax=Mesorhizobium mediterraneum TaxID=43617 RepID=A0AB36RER4_9HYPH|nr:hypothetical protein CIT25_05925 [Mesorhizobium mediterraneum]